MSANPRVKAIQITAQKKAFYRQRIPGSSCVRKVTVDIVIHVTSRNGDKKNHAIYQNNEQNSHKNKEVQPVE